MIAGRAALSIALFLVIASGGLLLLLPYGSAEFVVSAFTLAIGVLFGALALFLIRR